MGALRSHFVVSEGNLPQPRLHQQSIFYLLKSVIQKFPCETTMLVVMLLLKNGSLLLRQIERFGSILRYGPLRNTFIPSSPRSLGQVGDWRRGTKDGAAAS